LSSNQAKGEKKAEVIRQKAEGFGANPMTRFTALPAGCSSSGAAQLRQLASDLIRIEKMISPSPLILGIFKFPTAFPSGKKVEALISFRTIFVRLLS
jgi:hypothetical protein